MSLRWVHAALILLSAALAVLFGVWCLGQYGRDHAVANLLGGISAFAAIDGGGNTAHDNGDPQCFGLVCN